MTIEETMAIIDANGICYDTINRNHLKIDTANGTINFYPSSGTFHYNNEKSIGKSVYQLMEHLGINEPRSFVASSDEEEDDTFDWLDENVPSIEKSPIENKTIKPPPPQKSNNNILRNISMADSRNIMKLKYKRLDKDAFPPRKTRLTDAGVDLYAVKDAVWQQHGSQWFCIVETGIALEIPPYHYLATAPRSSALFGDDHVSTFHSVLDTGYKGEITFLCNSFSEEMPQIIKRGDRMSQVVLVPIPMIDTSFEEVEELPSHSDRDKLGFGSSGDTPWEK